jgi:hypothetical protein
MSTLHFKLFVILPLLGGAVLSKASSSILKDLPSSPTLNVTTIPGNGDINPYGASYVPQWFPKGGAVNPGDILVSNFNNSANLQGTGTSIVDITQAGGSKPFFQGQGLGLTTALGVLTGGYVLAGSVPTTDGTFGTINQGSLLILDKFGHQVANLSNGMFFNGPWDLTVSDDGFFAHVFVSNVLSGTVTRMDVLEFPFFEVWDVKQIASGYTHAANAAALVVGPTGLAYDSNRDYLYVASTGDNKIYGIPSAGRRTTDDGHGAVVYRDNAHLRGPLGLVLAPNGHLITTNGDAINANANQPSEMVEFTTTGGFVAQRSVDLTGEGGAFGLAITGTATNFQLAAVDDITNTLEVWTVGHNGTP